jgi:uncharacterized protein YjlB
MPVVENVKKLAGKLIRWSRPAKSELASLVRRRKPITVYLEDDGVVPNHPHWPLVVYRGAVRLPAKFDPATVLESLFDSNGWGDSWRNGIYDYVHYHSRTHEVLGVARGRAKVRFGGNSGRTLSLKAGDVAILPAGTGHQCLSASSQFLVVGAYPPSGTYDECTSSEDHARALKTIPKVSKPANDPVFGKEGSLLKLWTSRGRTSTSSSKG